MRPVVAAASTLVQSPRTASTARGERLGGSGQGLVEYGLILMVMAVVCVVSLVFFGDQLSSLLSLIASAV